MVFLVFSNSPHNSTILLTKWIALWNRRDSRTKIFTRPKFPWHTHVKRLVSVTEIFSVRYILLWMQVLVWGCVRTWMYVCMHVDWVLFRLHGDPLVWSCDPCLDTPLFTKAYAHLDPGVTIPLLLHSTGIQIYKPEVSWVRLSATAFFFTFLYYCLKTSKFTHPFTVGTSCSNYLACTCMKCA